MPQPAFLARGADPSEVSLFRVGGDGDHLGVDCLEALEGVGVGDDLGAVDGKEGQMGEVGKKGGVGRSNENIKKKGIQLCRLKEKESTQFNSPPPKKRKRKKRRGKR